MKPRFTLRGVGLLVTLLATGLALWANGARRQHEAAWEIIRLGGSVTLGLMMVCRQPKTTAGSFFFVASD
jgi:hypothetical protein